MWSFDLDDVRDTAAEYGYNQCQFDSYEGVVAFRRESTDPEDSRGELVRVWYDTRTVGTYLKHPKTKVAGT